MGPQKLTKTYKNTHKWGEILKIVLGRNEHRTPLLDNIQLNGRCYKDEAYKNWSWNATS